MNSVWLVLPTLRLTYQDDAVTRFWSYAVAGAVLTLRSGVIGGKTKSETKVYASDAAAQERAAKLLSAKVDAGYFVDDLPVELRRFADVADEIHVAGNSEEPDDRVWVFPASVAIPHSLWMDYRAGWLRVADNEAPIAGILVRGDLDIDGCLVNFEDDSGPFLEVHGNLTARSIATGGSQIHVTGSITTGDLVGVYNHGCVHADGDVNARTIATEHTVEAKGVVTAHRYDGWGATVYAVRGSDIDTADPYEPKGVFAASLVRDGSVDLSLARRWLAAGKPISRPAFSSVRDEFRKKVGAKLATPEKVKSLSLSGKDLTSLPDELFAFRKLERLDLTHNQLRTLPDRIGELTELRELHLRGNGLQKLPDSIGDLTRLEHLDLEANCLVGLPTSLARCTRLKTVNLTNNPYSYVRSSFGRWQDVALMWALPECLAALPALEQLQFDQTFVRSLPARPFASPHLAPIEVKRTLLLDHDPALHPQLRVDIASSREKAADYIRYWFDRDHVRLELFYDPKTRRYDFAEVSALLDLILRIVIPAAAPYDTALENFEIESRDIARWINDDGDADEHVRQLFTALDAVLDQWQHKASDNPLITALRPIFLAYV
jgi:predicted DNA-binding WGR domain protein